jgi:hypothetical protein
LQAFEFVIVLVSLILGLGLTHILETFARGLKGDYSSGVVHALWAILTGLLIVQQFWSRWEFVGREEWSIIQLALFLLPALLAYLAAALLSPPTSLSGQVDEYFLSRRRPFFVILIMLMVSDTIEDRFNLGELNLDIDALRLAMISLFIGGMLSTRRSIQIGVAAAAILILVTFTLGWTSSLASFAVSQQAFAAGGISIWVAHCVCCCHPSPQQKYKIVRTRKEVVA